ncbi:MAG: DNA circularization N-terminal domain-containing protein [Alphaproteobacteria bacterium]|nr:DNA circularization N-terminal domain-containing protein [Alphaproteobacteria bacterium]
MVDFRSELRSSSFRGIAFEMVDDDAAGGRRIVTHEFPGRDDPFHEDLGAAVRAFSFRAVIIGSGYVARADALEQALLQAGAATLVHPHYGEIQVVVKDTRRSHTNTTIGSVEFSVSVERYSATGGITVLGDTARKLTFASSSMADLATTDFLSGLAEGPFPSFVMADGIVRLSSFLSLARDMFRFNSLAGMPALPTFGALDAGAADQIATLFKGVVATARPQEIPIVGSAPAVVAANSEPIKLMRTLAKIADSSIDSSITPSSPSRQAMVANATAITTLVKTHALAAAAGVARYATYDSRNQAIETRDLLADSLVSLRDRQLTAGLIPAWRATTGVLVAVTEDINDRIGRLPRTVKVQGSAVRPSLAVANRLYGNDSSIIFDRAADIVKRNNIPHPGFIGAKPLEVLING